MIASRKTRRAWALAAALSVVLAAPGPYSYRAAAAELQSAAGAPSAGIPVRVLSSLPELLTLAAPGATPLSVEKWLSNGAAGLPEGPAAQALKGFSPEGLETLRALARSAALAAPGPAARAWRAVKGPAMPLPGGREKAAARLRKLDEALRRIPPQDASDPARLEAAAAALWDKGDGLALAPEAAARWPAVRSAVLGQAARLREGLDARADEMRSKLSAAAFQEALDTNAIRHEDESGRAELNAVDRQPVRRVVHDPTDLSVLFVDADKVSPDSAHLRQFVARQHIDAGTGRVDRKAGRDVVLVWERADKPISEQFLARPARGSLAWWKDYWHATWKRPSRTDVLVIGPVIGAGLQGGLAYGVEKALVLMHWSHGVDMLPILFTMGFGLVLGIFNSTYRNWTYRGNLRAQIAKSAVISVLFAYPVSSASHGIGYFNPATLQGLKHNASNLLNVFFNNKGKVAWQQASRMGEAHRLYAKKLPLGINRAAVAYQLMYTINWFFRLLPLIAMHLSTPVFVGAWTIFLSSIVFSRKFVKDYAQRHGFEEAAQIAQKWESDKAAAKRRLGAPARWARRVFSRPAA